MSWSTAMSYPADRAFADAAIDNIPAPQSADSAALAQFATAKAAAKEIVKTLPGPYFSINMSGHANGVGWTKKEGFANDMISVNVSQVTADDLKYYTKPAS